jgi:predicted nucleotidyltransferase
MDVAAMLDRFTQLCRSDDRILAGLLVGSHAAGSPDAQSDIDVQVVVDAAMYDAVVTSRAELVRALGQALFIEDFDLPDTVFAIFADGTELELSIARADELVLDGPYRIVVDKTDVIGRAATGPAPRDGTEAVRRQITWFWHDLSHFATALARGQLVWAYGQLDDLRRYRLNLARLHADPNADMEAYWKADATLPIEDLEAVSATVVPMDSDAMRAAAQRILSDYRVLARRLAERHGLSYPSELDAVVSPRLVDRSRPP